MIRNYSIGQRYMAYVLLFSFLLQSCNSPSIPTQPLATKKVLVNSEAEAKQSPIQMEFVAYEPSTINSFQTSSFKTNQTEVTPMALERKEATHASFHGIDNSASKLSNAQLDWISREGHIVHKLYRVEDSLRARVVDKASPQLVYDLPVYIFPGCSLDKIATYPKKKLAHYLYINPSSKQSQGAVIVSPGGLNGAGKSKFTKYLKSIFKDEKIATEANLGSFEVFPRDVLKIVLSYVGSEGMKEVRTLNRTFYKLTTGYDKPKLGVGYKPEASMLTAALSLHIKVLNFKSLGVKLLTPHNIPSFPFYRLIGEVHNIPPSFWPYLAGTNIQMLDLSYNQIGTGGAIELANHLKGTHVQTLDLGGNQIGDAGAVELAKHLKGTHVQTLGLSYNGIGDAGAVELAKHLKDTHVQTLDLRGNRIGGALAVELAKNLPGTHIQTLDLSYNEIGDAGAVELAKHLKDTHIQTLNLMGRDNKIGYQTQQKLKEQYSHINWSF